MKNFPSIVNLVDTNVQSSFNVLTVGMEPVEEELDGESVVVLSPSNSSGLEYVDVG